MSEVQLLTGPYAPPDTDAIHTEVSPVIAAAHALVVRDVVEHRAGLELLARVMDAKDLVKKKFKPLIEAVMEAKRTAEAARAQAVALEAEVLEPIVEAQKVISATCAAFEAEEKRAAYNTQRHLEQEARRKQEEDRELEAAMADDDQAEEILTAPLPAPIVPAVRPEVAKVAGLHSRATWSGEVTDKAAFAAWCVKTGNLYFLDVNMPQLNSRARAERDKMQIPGAKAVESMSHARR